MRQTKRRPVTVGQMLIEEFMGPLKISNKELAEAMGVHRNTISDIVNDKKLLTAPMAIRLGVALGNSAEFWLNIQHSVELWDIKHGAYQRLLDEAHVIDRETVSHANTYQNNRHL